LPHYRASVAELADRHDDAPPFIGAVAIAHAAHLLHHLARLRCGFFRLDRLVLNN